MPLPLLLAAAALPQLYKIGVGIHQLNKSKQFNRTRPVYQTPENLKKLLNITKFESSVGGLPGQSRIERNIGQGQANSINAVQRSGSSPAAMMAAISGIDQNTKNTYGDLGVQGAQYRDQKQGDYQRALGMMVEDERQAFQWNQADPYLQDMAAKAALKNAGLGNIGTALDDFSSIGQGLAFNQPNRQTMGQAYGLSNQAPIATNQMIAPINNGNPYNVDDAFNQANPDDWSLYGDQMRKTYPGVSDETLRGLLPSFKSRFNKSYYGG